MKKYPYSVTAAISYAIILLLTLWWLPIVGPIIIGYITGRKSGGPVKGVVAMSVPIFLYFSFIFAVAQGWINIPRVFSTEFIGTLISTFGSLPVFSFLSYADATLNLAMHVGTYFQHYLYYAPPSFFIMLSFAFIGGAVSRMVILEHGIFPEKKPLFVRKKDKLQEEDVPKPFHSHVMMVQPVGRVKPFVIPEEESGEEAAESNAVETANMEKRGTGHRMRPAKLKVDEEERGAEVSVKEKMVKNKLGKRRTRKRRGLRKFEDEESSKFVIHPVEEPKPVIVSGKKINKKHSITFL